MLGESGMLIFEMPSPVVNSCEAGGVPTSSTRAANIVAIVSLAFMAVCMAFEVFLKRERNVASCAGWRRALERFEVAFLVTIICRLVFG
jgi:hypothetical protein